MLIFSMDVSTLNLWEAEHGFEPPTFCNGEFETREPLDNFTVFLFLRHEARLLPNFAECLNCRQDTFIVIFKTRCIQWRNSRGEGGQSKPLVKLNVKTGPPFSFYNI